MEYVKIKGKSLQECLLQMKMQYGPDAHFYNQRVVTEGGWMGSGFLAKKMIEIEVGIPEKQVTKDRVERNVNDLKELIRKKNIENRNLKSSEQELVSLGKISERRLAQYSQMERVEEIPQVMSIEPRESLGISIQKDIQSKLELDSLVAKKSNPILSKLMSRWSEEGIPSSYIDEITKEVQRKLSPADETKSSAVSERLAEVLAERIEVDSDLFSGTGKGQRKIVFLVGSTGSGKTTTIAKLAAKYYLHMGKKVSLYTTDHYRIAAIDQLKKYADTIGIPFYAVRDPKKFREALSQDTSELILVDTAGYSHKSSENRFKLKEFMSGLPSKECVEPILVVSANISRNNAKSILEAYEELNPKRILLTKLDETDFLGSFLELADNHHKEFAYFSVGQDVPFDILPAERNLLAESVVFPEKLKGMIGEVFAVTV